MKTNAKLFSAYEKRLLSLVEFKNIKIHVMAFKKKNTDINGMR